jgi:hypothetical protein
MAAGWRLNLETRRRLLAQGPMNLLFGLGLSASLLGSSRPIATAEPDSSSAFPRLTPEDALFLLQSEHHFSFPILLLEDPATPSR